MRARLLGWPVRKKKVFRTLFEQKFSYIYTAYFSFEFSFEIRFFFERTAFKRKPKMKKIRKNGFWKTFFNFERTLFDQTTSSPHDHFPQTFLGKKSKEHSHSWKIITSNLLFYFFRIFTHWNNFTISQLFNG